MVQRVGLLGENRPERSSASRSGCTAPKPKSADAGGYSAASQRRARVELPPGDMDPVNGRARLSYRQVADLFTMASGGATLHQLRQSALTYAAEDGTSAPMLMARSGAHLSAVAGQVRARFSRGAQTAPGRDRPGPARALNRRAHQTSAPHAWHQPSDTAAEGCLQTMPDSRSISASASSSATRTFGQLVAQADRLGLDLGGALSSPLHAREALRGRDRGPLHEREACQLAANRRGAMAGFPACKFACVTWLACKTRGMQLREVQVENFRPFESAVIRLPATGLVLIAGANNAGKSALLSALDVVAGVGSDFQALRRAGSAGPARVAATFTLEPDERAKWLRPSPRGEAFLASGAMERVQYVFDQWQLGAAPALAQLLGDRPGHGLEPLMTTSLIEGEGTYQTRVIRGLLGGDEREDSFLLIPYGGASSAPGVTEHVVGAVSALRPLTQMLGEWQQRYYHFRALRPGSRRSANLAATPRMAPTGENLTEVLLDLLTNRPDLFAHLRSLITTIVPHVGQLEVRTGGNQMQAVFATRDIELNLKDLGTGVEQLMMTLIVGLTEAPPLTLVIEEPETNLHHAAQRALLGLLKDWSADRQIIAATHSPVMLDWSPGGERLWHVIKEPDHSVVKPVDADPAGLLEALGVRLSDVLSATRVLVLEGSSDEDVLGAWFPDILRNPAVAVLHGGGGDNARHADRLAEWLEGVDKIGLRKVLYLRDRDELSPKALNALQASETVGVLERRELENYLLDPEAVAQVLAPLVPEGQEPPSAEDVARFMGDTAEGLRRKIVVNRVCNQVQPARPLMEHKLRQQLAKDNADEAGVVASVLERLMTAAELRAQVTAAWAAAEADVANHTGRDLLEIAPGDEILTAVFQRFARRGYNKRVDGVAIARAMSAPPEEIQGLLDAFMSE